MKLAASAINRPLMTAVFYMILIILGGISFMRLPIDLMPDVSFPTITVRTNYTGVGPQEIEKLVTEPIERALGSVPGIEEITSTSSEGSSSVRVSFVWGSDLAEAAEEVRTRIDRIRAILPEDSDPPIIFKFDISQFPIMFLAVSGEMDPRDLRYFVEDQIQYRLERARGVAAVDIRGGLRREIHVNLNRERLQSMQIGTDQVLSALRRENLDLPAGQVYEGEFEVLLRTQGEFTNLEQIEQTVVAMRGGVPVRVRDIARVEDSYEEVRDLTRVDGRPGIRLFVRKQSGSNTVAVAQEVKKEIERINRDFQHVRVGVSYDTSRFIENSIKSVRQAALFGSILAVVVLLLFLRNIRSALIVAIAIPISVIATFALMFYYGFTLNTITFGGLALGVGMLVDSAIVVLENIYRHREAGLEKKEAAALGTREVGPAIIASALTTMVVFLPVVFTAGMSGVMFKQLAYVVSFSLICSLFVALTLVPVLSSKLIRVRQPNEKSLVYKFVHMGGTLLDRLDGTYQNAIHWALDHRKTVVFSTMALFAGALLLVPLVGVELSPETDEGEVRLSFELAPGSTLEASDAVARQLEQLISQQIPEADHVMTEVGSGGGGWGQGSVSSGSLRVILKERSQRSRSSMEIADALRPALNQMTGVRVRARTGGMSRITRMTSSTDDRLSVEVRGHDLDQARELAVQVRRIMETIPGVTDALLSQSEGRPENQIIVDRTRAADVGLSVSEIANTLRTTVGGTRATMFRERGDEFNVLVRYEETDRKDLDKVLDTPIQTPSGKIVPLRSLVVLQPAQGPVAIERKNNERNIIVSANLAKRDLGSVVADLQYRLRELPVPLDFALLMGSEYEEQQRAFGDLIMSIILAIVLVYLVMVAQFESFRYPLIIMFSIPLALIGVVLALVLTNTTFNMQGFIGAIMLAGIVVNNAIVLVDYTNLLRREHNYSLRQALEVSGRRRLRPILMTTLTTVLGLVPMALGLGEGSELQVPMARVVIGGLLSSTLITLLFVPTLYMMIEGKRVKEEATEMVGEAEAAR
jgi:hydrophobic/amphiphilic exporter-1 (mainly G- bacteria), HAE1 family